MGSTSTTERALAVLHYLAPVVIAVYFVVAKIIAACFLQQPSKRAGSKYRRYPATILQLVILATVTAEGIACIAQAARQNDWSAAQDYIIYLSASFVLHCSLAIGLLENTSPLWRLYLGSWLFEFSFDVAIIALQGVRVPENGYSKSRMAFCAVRTFVALVLCIGTACCMLSDRTRSIRLGDSESDALLRKSSSSPRDSLFPDNTPEANDEAGLDDDADFDSDSEEPERDRELKAAQRKRLQESGSWLNYLKEFKIFIPMLLPTDDRYIQFCLVVMGTTIIARRILNILVPMQLGRIVNALTMAAGTGIVPWRPIGLWMLFTYLNSSAGVSLLKEIVELPVTQYGFKAISTTSFRHIMGLSMDFHNEKNSGELIRAIEQGTNLQELLNFIFFDVGPMFFDLIVAFVYVAYLFDIYMSMILFVVGIAYIWVGAKVTTWSIKQRRDYNNAYREESRVQNEAINNWQTVSHFNRGQYESDRYSTTVDAYNLAVWRYWLAYYAGGGVQSFIMLIGKLAAVLLAAYRVTQGRAGVGDFITLVTYWSSIQSPLGSVAYSVRKVSQLLTDSERLLQLLTTKPSIVDAPEAQEINITSGEVVFEHVDFSYDPRKPTLKDVDFKVKPGQTVALVGETGGGKSTILKLLYRYYDVNGGAIRIDDQDIRKVTLDSLRDSFGMVPQDPSLFNISVMENIRYARLDATDEEVKDACKAAAIHDKIESFPDGYKAKVGERGVKLSGGEMQRVAIARAILRRPKIVLLDEATSMIDAETEATIQSAFKKLTAQRTTFIVAHRLSTIQHADLILVINDGQIIERGTHEELFRLNGKYVALWSKQLSKEVQDIGKKLDVASEADTLVDVGEEEVGDGDGERE